MKVKAVLLVWAFLALGAMLLSGCGGIREHHEKHIEEVVGDGGSEVR